MKGIFLILIIVSCMQSCKDYLNLIPKGEKIVSNVDDVRSELLSFWVSHTYSSLPTSATQESHHSRLHYH